jgi:glycine/D-amino acid oxidase-like deaminating enzyme/nitrite reductase/ring-hydroxylating ferredoxin subunit
MLSHSHQHDSYWQRTAPGLETGALTHDVEADVCIVGGGIAGMTTAYLLAQEGRRVVVLDDGPVGYGETGRTTAHLASAIDDRFTELEKIHGEKGARLAADSHAAAIDRIEGIVEREKIDCDFQRLDGYLFAPDKAGAELIDKEFAAAQRAGLVEVERRAAAPVPFSTGPCLRFPRQGQFHPLKYLAGLLRALRGAGGQAFTQTHVESIEGGDRPSARVAGGRTVRAKAIVVATNSPVNNLVAIHTKQAAYRTYVVGLQMPAGVLKPALFWDTLDPYHYLRLAAGQTTVPGSPAWDLFILGGEDHKTGQANDADERFSRLERWGRERFSELGEVHFRWSGQVMETVDGLAFIGPNPWDKENIYIATGDSGMGMTHGTIAGMLLTDLILGRSNPWAALYDPSRKSVRAVGNFASENLNVAWQYTDWLTPGEVEGPEKIERDSGAIVRRGLKKVAVYRDEENRLHEMSAVCPHLGCVVAWNNAEKTWECPCHGSRFDRCGHVISGPANSDLPSVTHDSGLPQESTSLR